MTVKEFIDNLSALPWPKVPDTKGLRQYYQYLNRETINASQLDEVYRMLSENGKFFPLLGEVRQTIAAVKRNSASDPIWQTWQDSRGRPYARRVWSMENIPPASVDAVNVRLAIPPDMAAYNEPDPGQAKRFEEIVGELANADD